MAAHPIIVMWTTPRSRSTAFERMMIERGDHLVIDEPFSARYYFSSERRSDRYGEDEADATGAAVLQELLDAAAERPVFVKDMAYHVSGLLSEEFLSNFTNTFLVREPTAAISSLARKWPDFTAEEAGYTELANAHRLTEGLQGSPAIVLEADELATDPEHLVQAWCTAVGIPFVEDALSWEPGMVPQWIRWRDWYEGVATSTGFRPPAPSGAGVANKAGRSAEAPAVSDAVSTALPLYGRMVETRVAGLPGR